MLELLGVSNAASIVYQALVAEPQLGVGGLAERVGLSEADVRTALDELIDLSLVTHGTAESGLRVVGPSAGLGALLASAEAAIARRQEELSAARLAVSALIAQHDGARQRDQSTRLDGIDAVRSRLDELAAAASVECVSLNPTVSQTSDAKAASAPLNKLMLERGVAIRSVYQDSFRNDPILVRYAREFAAQGGQLRTAPVVPLLLIVYDRSVALLPIDAENSRLGAHEIRSQGIVAAAYALFEQIWVTSTAFGGPPPDPSRAEISAQTRTLLHLLAAGGTDEVVARRLGVSVRTAKRLAKELMARLDARSRFEAGVKAAHRGWI